MPKKARKPAWLVGEKSGDFKTVYQDCETVVTLLEVLVASNSYTYYPIQSLLFVPCTSNSHRLCRKTIKLTPLCHFHRLQLLFESIWASETLRSLFLWKFRPKMRKLSLYRDWQKPNLLRRYWITNTKINPPRPLTLISAFLWAY